MPHPLRHPEHPVRREFGAVVRLATPVVAVQLGMMLMGTVDTMMLGRYSATALAAGGLGHATYFGLFVFFMGLLFGLDPLVSQAVGAKDEARVARHIQVGLGAALLATIPLSLVMWDVRWALRLLGQDPAIIEPTAQYLWGLIPGNVGFLVFLALRQSLQAMSMVRQAVWAIVISNLVNVFANWVLIFGNLGFPELGVLGSAYASSISRGVMAAVILVAGWRVLRPYLTNIRHAVLRPAAYADLLRIGVPVGFMTSVESWLFVAVAMMMGSLGATEIAAHQISITLAALAFMVPLGISGAASTRVGNAIGARDSEGARRSATVCLFLGAGVMTVSAAIFATLPGQLSRLFTPEAHVVEVAMVLLPIAALFQVFDGVQVVAAGVLRGAADTRIPAILAVCGYWGLGLPLGWWLGLHLDWGPRGLWWGLTLGLASVAVLLLLRIRRRFAGELAAIESR